MRRRPRVEQSLAAPAHTCRFGVVDIGSLHSVSSRVFRLPCAAVAACSALNGKQLSALPLAVASDAAYSFSCRAIVSYGEALCNQRIVFSDVCAHTHACPAARDTLVTQPLVHAN